jgi:arylsulfatase A-like enzyme/predicted neuraminidase
MRFALSAIALVVCASLAVAAPPNVVLFFADDLGYADLGCFGATKWKTSNLDRIASEGVRFTDFHVSQPVCSASRCSLLTGCYANRLGIHGALGPQARHGIHANETTLAEVLKAKGYATGMVGKWHLGHHPQFLPTRHGFDSYLGLPYSNDMWPHHPEAKKGAYPKLPLIDGDKVIDHDVTAEDQALLTAKYRDRAVQFIQENKTKPFFLYFAHTFPHVPLFVGEKFRGSSVEGGVYGDVLQEFDSAVGDVLAALKAAGVEDNTLVIFTSDNGPWLSYGNHAGTKGPLREGKGSVWEGGVRVPFVAKWPGKIPPKSVQTEPAMTIDLLPTIAKLAGADLPQLPIDGKDIGDLLLAKPGAKCPHAAYFHYFAQGELQAVRSGKWKLILPHTCRMIEDRAPGQDGKPAGYRQVKLDTMLFDLGADVGETKNVADRHPDVLKAMLDHAERARADLGDALTKRRGSGTREPGRVADPPAKQFSSELVFPLNPKHNHAPGIVECPNGDLLVSWYRGSGERSADDVSVLGARLPKGADRWSDEFLLADTPGFPDCNTTLFIDAKERLWLFWPVILANSWESCVTQYRVSSKYATGMPTWDWQGSLFLKPVDFEATMLREFAAWKKTLDVSIPAAFGDEYVKKKVGDKLLSRLGWQPRCKPTVLSTDRILLPLYSDTYSAGLMAISDDEGKTWTASKPLAGFGSIQPAVLERKDGSLVAYMRENGVFRKVRVSESTDRGMTWGTVTSLDLPNPGSGLDAVRLANGHFVLIYNDSTRGRSSLAVSISDDEGKTWKWTRHLERHESGSYHYPAIVQGRDGTVHAVYSYFVKDGKSMKHVAFTEDWVKAGDDKPSTGTAR